MYDFLISSERCDTHLSQKNVDLKPSRNETIKITIPYETIDSVSLSGSGDVNAINIINSDNFYINLTGYH